MNPWLAFALGVGAYWAYEHFFSAPHAPMGKYGKSGG